MPSPRKSEDIDLNSVLKRIEILEERNNRAIKALEERVNSISGARTPKGKAKTLRTVNPHAPERVGASYDTNAGGGEDGLDVDDNDPEVSFPQNGSVAANLSAGSQPRREGFSAMQTEDLQAEFRAIADVYSRFCLPGDMKFNGFKAGLKQSTLGPA